MTIVFFSLTIGVIVNQLNTNQILQAEAEDIASENQFADAVLTHVATENYNDFTAVYGFGIESEDGGKQSSEEGKGFFARMWQRVKDFFTWIKNMLTRFWDWVTGKQKEAEKKKEVVKEAVSTGAGDIKAEKLTTAAEKANKGKFFNASKFNKYKNKVKVSQEASDEVEILMARIQAAFEGWGSLTKKMHAATVKETVTGATLATLFRKHNVSELSVSFLQLKQVFGASDTLTGIITDFEKQAVTLKTALSTGALQVEDFVKLLAEHNPLNYMPPEIKAVADQHGGINNAFFDAIITEQVKKQKPSLELISSNAIKTLKDLREFDATIKQINECVEFTNRLDRTIEILDALGADRIQKLMEDNYAFDQSVLKAVSEFMRDFMKMLNAIRYLISGLTTGLIQYTDTMASVATFYISTYRPGLEAAKKLKEMGVDEEEVTLMLATE